MPKKIKLKTAKNQKSPAAFINRFENETLKKDCQVLLEIFQEVTGMPPKMWGDSIVGFGEYIYHRSNGDEGVFMATGFSPRKSGPTLYIMTGFDGHEKELSKLGPHKCSKSCLYLKSLEGIDQKILIKLIKKGLKSLKEKYQTNY